MKFLSHFLFCFCARAKLLALCALICGAGSSVLADDKPPLDLQPVATRGVRAHDPSTIVKCKDEYWVFCTGKYLPSYHSKDLRTWDPGPHILSNPPPWIAQAVPANSGADFWAPDVMRVGDRYLRWPRG